MQTIDWYAFFNAFLKVSGYFIAILLFFILFSVISALFSRFAKIKPKTIITTLPDAEGNKKSLSKNVPVILQINIRGVIGKDELDTEWIDTQLVDSRLGELKPNRVKGILLNIDSPGGSATDSDAIYRRLKAYKAKFKVPVFAYVDGMCASGGYFIACAADKIFASPSSIAGSVGVMWMLPFFNVHKVLERWDIDVRTYSAGKNKDHLNPFRPWRDDEDQDLKKLLDHTYKRFVDVVVNERPKISADQLVHEYGAQIFSASEGTEIGFLDDGNCDYYQALKALVKAAKIDVYQVLELKKKKAWFREMIAHSPFLTGKIHHEIQLNPYSHLVGKAAYLFKPSNIYY